jgi:hypothetical protein
MPVVVVPLRNARGSRLSWLMTRSVHESRPSIRSSSAAVFARCVPVAMRIVSPRRRGLRHLLESALRISMRGCARVMSHTEIATRCPAGDLGERRPIERVAESGRSVRCGSGAAGAGSAR